MAPQPTMKLSRWTHAHVKDGNPWGAPGGTSFAARKFGNKGIVVIIDDPDTQRLEAPVLSGQLFSQLFVLQRRGAEYDTLPKEQWDDRFLECMTRGTFTGQVVHELESL